MRLSSLAIRAFNMEAMTAFYAEAFGFEFRDVEIGSMVCRFGRAGELELKLVPIRAAPDFEGFPSHQPGFLVNDIDQTVRIAEKHGGVSMGATAMNDEGFLHAGIRDPDGNTIELYEEGSSR